MPLASSPTTVPSSVSGRGATTALTGIGSTVGSSTCNLVAVAIDGPSLLASWVCRLVAHYCANGG